jgi:hypothetical protein
VIGIVLLLVAPAVLGAVAVRRGRVSTAGAVAGWLCVSTLVVVVLVGQALFADEGALPPDDVRDRLPAGLRVAAQEQSCGSGGCFREYTVRDVGGAPGATVAARLRAEGFDACRRRLWVPDLRLQCADVSEGRDGVRVAVSLVGW